MGKFSAALHPRGAGGKFAKKGRGSKSARYNAKQDHLIKSYDAARKVTAGKRTKAQHKIIKKAAGELRYHEQSDGGDTTRFSRHVVAVHGGKKVRG